MEDEAKCSVCQDFFTAPIRIAKCGHSFCQNCLTQVIATGRSNGLCPECRQEQNLTPEQLPRNYALEQIVEKFKSLKKTICATHNSQKKFRKYFEIYSLILF